MVADGRGIRSIGVFLNFCYYDFLLLGRQIGSSDWFFHCSLCRVKIKSHKCWEIIIPDNKTNKLKSWLQCLKKICIKKKKKLCPQWVRTHTLLHDTQTMQLNELLWQDKKLICCAAYWSLQDGPGPILSWHGNVVMNRAL